MQTDAALDLIRLHDRSPERTCHALDGHVIVGWADAATRKNHVGGSGEELHLARNVCRSRPGP